MSRARRVAVVVLAAMLVVVLVAVTAVVLLLRRPVPDYAGEVVVPGLGSSVQVLRDARGVPQVYADDAEDLFFAQGYVQAQDRFFQMDLRRHIASGRLSELVGDVPLALQSDVAVRTMGWRRVAEAELPLLEDSTRRYLRAYADGVNAYAQDRSPSALSATYTVLGTTVELEPVEPWTPVDSLAWLKAMAWGLKDNYSAELGRALAYGSVGDVGLVEQLYPSADVGVDAPVLPASDADADADADAGTGTGTGTDTGTAVTADGTGASSRPAAQQGTRLGELSDASDALATVQEALDAIPDLVGSDMADDGIGSNAWVVSGDLTATGAPLLANDPHLAVSLPSFWSQSGLHCREVGAACPFDVAGFTLAGVPGVVIGHNADIAWGFTNLGADVTDFFLEDVDADGTYLRDGRRVPLQTRTETIEVAGADPLQVEVRSTVHGPLLSDVLADVSAAGRAAPVPENAPTAGGGGYEVALAWTALTPGRTMDAVFALDRATDWGSFRAAAALFEVPAQNMLYADTDGRIGYQTPGRIPVRRVGPGLGQADGTWPRPGWDPSWDWAGTVPFSALPSVLDPEQGFLVTANQPVTADGEGPFLTADWDYGYRAQRIRSVLAGWAADGHEITAQDVRDLQADVVDPFASTLVPYLLEAPLPRDGEDDTAERREFVRQAVDLLRSWDFTTGEESSAAAYYEAVWANLLRLTFADQLPAAAQPAGGSRWFAVVGQLLEQPDSPWWDDATTATVVETRDQVLGEALTQARLELTAHLGADPEGWEWGDLHRLVLRQQPLGDDSVPAPVRDLWTAGPVALGGSGSVVDATSWDAREGYEATAVPSMRMVVDLADLDASTWVNLTGVSEHPASGHMTDQLETWADGGTYPWPFSRDAVEDAAEDELVLRPGQASEG